MVAVGVLADGYFSAPSSHHGSAELTRLPAVTLDQLVRDHAVRPSHVKIDVEGFEMDVLRGGQELLSADPQPLVFLELHNHIIRERGEDPAVVLGLLTARGYGLHDSFGRPASQASLLAFPVVRLVARPTMSWPASPRA